MKTLTTVLVTSSVLALSACATIIEGSDDKINIATTPPSNAACTLTSKRGVYQSYAGAQASVKKSRSDLNVACADPATGASGQSTVVSDVEPWAFGNILLGGLIGAAVDWSTGAAYDYPAATTVSLTSPTAYTPAPAYPATAYPAPAPAVTAPVPTYAPQPASPAPYQYQSVTPQATPQPGRSY